MKNFLNNTAYDIIKWLSIIVIPALGVAYKALSAIWGLPFGEEVMQTTQVITVLLGAILGISTIHYNKENTGE